MMSEAILAGILTSVLVSIMTLVWPPLASWILRTYLSMFLLLLARHRDYVRREHEFIVASVEEQYEEYLHVGYSRSQAISLALLRHVGELNPLAIWSKTRADDQAAAGRGGAHDAPIDRPTVVGAGAILGMVASSAGEVTSGVVGLLLMLGITLLNNRVRRFTPLLMLAAILALNWSLLPATTIPALTRRGPSVDIGAVATFAVVLYIAAFVAALQKTPDRRRALTDYLPFAGMVGLIVGISASQADIASAVTILATAGAMLAFAPGGPKALVALALASVGSITWLLLFTPSRTEWLLGGLTAPASEGDPFAVLPALGLTVVLLGRAAWISRRVQDPFKRSIAIGLVVWLSAAPLFWVAAGEVSLSRAPVHVPVAGGAVYEYVLFLSALALLSARAPQPTSPSRPETTEPHAIMVATE